MLHQKASRNKTSPVFCVVAPLPSLVILHKQSPPGGEETTQNSCAGRRSRVHVLASNRSALLSNSKDHETITSFCCYFRCTRVNPRLANQENAAAANQEAGPDLTCFTASHIVQLGH